MLRLLADENLSGEVVRSLLHQQPGLDLERVQDVGLAGADDVAVLAWAAANDRIVVTHDHATMPGLAYLRVAEGQTMPGVFVLSDRLVVRQAVQEILLVVDCSDQAEWAGRVVYLPL